MPLLCAPEEEPRLCFGRHRALLGHDLVVCNALPVIEMIRSRYPRSAGRLAYVRWGGWGEAAGAACAPEAAPSDMYKAALSMLATSAAADGAFSTRGFRLEERSVKIGKVFQFKARNFLADEPLDRLEGGKFFAGHQGEGVADILRPASAADPMDVIFGMFRHVIVDDVADAGDVEST